MGTGMEAISYNRAFTEVKEIIAEQPTVEPKRTAERINTASEPMVSVESVIDRLVASWDDEYKQYMIGPVMAWLNEKSGK